MYNPFQVPNNTPIEGSERQLHPSDLRVHELSEAKLKTHKKGRRSIGSSILPVDCSKSLVHCSCDRLHNELMMFVDDFVNSQEYQDYLDFKRKIIKEDKEVQYDLHDLMIVPPTEPPKRKKVDKLRALTRRALRVFYLEVKIKKYLEDLRNIESLRKQGEAIEVIRQKIEEVKHVFMCNAETKLPEKEKREKQLIENFISRYNIDISKMFSADKLGKAILDVERKLRMKKKRHKNNIRVIVEKLLKEVRQNKEHKGERKIIRKKKKTNMTENREGTVFHIEGRKGSQMLLSSIRVIRKEDPIIKAFEEAGVCIRKEILEDPMNFNIDNKEGLSILPDDTTIANRSESFSNLEDVSTLIPMEENMYKIKLTENAKEKLGIMESFVQFEDLLEARHFFCTCEKERKEKENAWMNYPLDSTIIFNPKEIIFKDWKEEKIYKKRLTLRNVSGTTVRLRFFKFHFEEIDHALYFKIEPDETKIARPGLQLDLVVKFSAPKELERIYGALVFLSCYNSTYYRFVVPLRCIIPSSDVLIDPLYLPFGVIPIWKISRGHHGFSKFIKIKGSQNDVHRVVIKKIRDPLETETSESELTNTSTSEVSSDRRKTPLELEMEGIVEDIIQDLNCSFRFDKYFLEIGEFSAEKNLKISIFEINNPGFYFEKYNVDIYKKEYDDFVYQGTQEILITLEVTDFFISCEPVCLDFGICFYGSAYQAGFNILNSSKYTHSLSVMIPSLLNYYVSLDENSLLLRAGEVRKVAVKLMPSEDIMTEKCKYFELDTSILYFPICVKLSDKKYSSVPPTVQHCYAILNDCSDLTLDPKREHYLYCDGEMLLDLGQCSINEAVTTQIVLRNSSYSKRYFGFLNLPKKPRMSRLVKLINRMLQEMKRTPDAELMRSILEAKCSVRNEIVPNPRSSLNSAAMKSYDFMDKLQDLIESDSDTDVQVENNEDGNVSMKQLYENKTESIGKSFDKSEFADYNIDIEVKKESETSLTEETLSEPDRRPSLLVKKNVNKLESIDYSPSLTSLVNLAETLSRELSLKMVFTKPLFEFTFNHVELPATPGGSYSVVTTELRPLKHTEQTNFCFPRKIRKDPKFRANFRIAGSSEELRIEPMCGVLESGDTSYREATETAGHLLCDCGAVLQKRLQHLGSCFLKPEQIMDVASRKSIKLTIVATPKIMDDDVAAYALEAKTNLLYSLKLESELKKKKEASAKTAKKAKGKVKNGKKGKKSNNIETPGDADEEIIIEIASGEVQLEYADLYPAELTLWRNMEPYFLNTKFVCRVDYETDGTWSHEPDIFSLQAVCKVVNPDFIHDQKAQRLDFGEVAVGDIVRKIVTIQNITYHDITVTTSILAPWGNFFCPYFDPVVLPSECFLKIPITYTPTEEESVQEYMEIISGRTVYQFVVSAEALMPYIRLEPTSKVIRVAVKRGKTLEVPFVIINDSQISVRVAVEKVCELEGRISKIRNIEEKSPKTDGRKNAEKKQKSPRSPRRKSVLCNSDELTEDEIHSIDSSFSIRKEPTLLHLKEENTPITIAASSKRTFRIEFGPRIPQAQGKRNKKKNETEVNEEDVGKTFIAKFNVLIGTSTFLNDFIVFGEIK